MSGPESAIAASALLDWVAQAIVLGTVLAGLTWAVTKALGSRISPGLAAGLWALVLVRFVLPVGPEWAWSLPSLVDRAVDRSRAALTTPVTAEEPVGDVTTATGTQLAAQAQQEHDRPWWPVPVALAYLSVVALLGGQRLVRNVRFIRHCMRLPGVDPGTEAVVRDVCRRLGVRRTPQVRVSEELPAPLITGALNPVLVLSRRQLSRPDELETVVVHEITHLRRGDLALRCLQWASSSLFFFWPVVAWINRRIDAAREHACDQWALRHGKLSPGAYARCLLQAASSVGASPMFRWSTCMAGNASFLERRIDMILNSSGRRASSPAGTLAAAAFVIAWGIFALTGAAGVQAGTSSHEELTDQALGEHAAQIVSRIARYPSADVDGNGEISFDERNAFLVSVTLSDPERSLECFSYSEPFQGRELDIMEAYDVVRGLSYRKKVEHSVKLKVAEAQESGLSDEEMQQIKHEASQKILDSTEVVLNGQDALLDRVVAEPSAEKVAMIHETIRAKQLSEKQFEIQKKSENLLKKAEELERQGRTEEAAELRQQYNKLQQMLEQKKVKM
ncbi:MAG TPA: M56 family metallopeptidase [Candidatus Sulfomarinibacteraceae bacterium]|nr:M56 family metallopeptidase [Candidatus Sulfomarinibacteraceae bacterium]